MTMIVVFWNYFCYLLSARLRESQKFLTFPIPSSFKSGKILISLISPPVTAGCFHLAETANFWRWDFHHLRFQNAQWLSNHKNTRKQKYLENVIPQMISWRKVHPGPRPLNSHSLFMDVFLLSDIPGLTRIGWCSCSNGGVLKHPIYEHASWCTNIPSLILKSSWNHHRIKSFKPYPY